MPRSQLLIPMLLLIAAAALPGQTVVYIPDPNPTVPGGTSANTIPFGSAAYTYMGSIPASSMDPLNTRLDDIAFAPGPAAPAATWNASSVLVAVGHLPSILPCPFSFPGPGGTTPGSFLDLTVVFDSSIHGPINWPWVPTTWSPMNLTTSVGGTNFTWDGTNDVGVFVTFTGASPTAAFLRSPTLPPGRTYASGYQVATSTACNSTFGLVMALHMSPAANLLSISQSGPGVGDLNIDLADLSSTATSGWMLLSGDVANPPGSGPFLGIYPDASTWLLLFTTPQGVGNPFHFPAVAPAGFFPNAPFVLGPGAVSSLTGMTVDVVFLLVQPGPFYDSKSNIVRFTFM